MRTDDAGPEELAFTSTFRIGRDEACEVQVGSGHASRCHAEVRYEDGAWWLRDLGSTNGTFVDGRRIDALRLEGTVEAQLGQGGPRLTITTEARRSISPITPTAEESSASPPSPAGATSAGSRRRPEEGPPAPPTRAKPGDAPAGRPAPGPTSRRFASTGEYVRHYFDPDADGEGAGMHTRMIRRAYAHVHARQSRRYRWVIAAAVVLCVAALSVVAYQQWRIGRIESVVYRLRSQEAAIAQFRIALERSYDASLDEQLRLLEEERGRLRARYVGYIEEFGTRRGLSEEEQVIWKVARIFNEARAELPPEFVRAVRRQIEVWKTTGRGTLIDAIAYAEEQGYTGPIVRTLQRYDLPPEFYYLALQESAFRTREVGPPTRYGYAKGMWQFIPETGIAYDLEVGPRVDDGVYDENDERHDFQKSTDAAARYLRDIYGQLAQASGLLAMASYNWGEHRVISKLEPLLEGIPDDPQARSYWRFYTAYSDRMPQQTKDYVIKIFSAAVIGENPRLFGFDFDNPLREYM